jgi:hypothetical protein
MRLGVLYQRRLAPRLNRGPSPFPSVPWRPGGPPVPSDRTPRHYVLKRVSAEPVLENAVILRSKPELLQCLLVVLRSPSRRPSVSLGLCSPLGYLRGHSWLVHFHRPILSSRCLPCTRLRLGEPHRRTLGSQSPVGAKSDCGGLIEGDRWSYSLLGGVRSAVGAVSVSLESPPERRKLTGGYQGAAAAYGRATKRAECCEGRRLAREAGCRRGERELGGGPGMPPWAESATWIGL